MSQPLIRFDGVDLGYDGKVVVSQIDLSVAEGDFLGLVGPNGAGKTTLLRGLLKMLPPMRGSVQHARELSVGYVPQRHSLDELFPVAAEDVVLMGRFRAMGWFAKKEDREIARRALEATGVADLADTPFRHLSGGQRQRVLISRALVAEPDVLVLDEPTNGMDLTGEGAVMQLVDRIHRERSLTVILVSHQLNMVARWVQQIGLLHRGGLVVGPTSEVLTQASLQNMYGDGVRVLTAEGQSIILPPGQGAE